MKKSILIILFVLFASSAHAVMPGQEGAIKWITMVCATKEFHDEFVNAQVSGDKDGIKELVIKAKCLPVDKGTRVLVIESSWTLRKVRIKTGPAKGIAGWVYVEAVQ